MKIHLIHLFSKLCTRLIFPSTFPVSDDCEAVQLVLLTPSGGWQPTTPPASLTASPQLSRKNEPILKSRGSFKFNSSKKHVSINEKKFNFGSNTSLKTLETSPIIVRIEDETENNLQVKLSRQCSYSEAENSLCDRNVGKTNIHIVNEYQTNKTDESLEKPVSNNQKSVNVRLSNDTTQSPTVKKKEMHLFRRSSKTSKQRPSSLLLNQDDENINTNEELHGNRSKSADESFSHSTEASNSTEKFKNMFPNVECANTIPNTELITRLKEKIFNRSNSVERNARATELESDDESTPLVSSERSSPSISVKTHQQTSQDENLPGMSPTYSSPCSSSNSHKNNSIDENSAGKARINQNSTIQKNLSPNNLDCDNSDLTISVEFSPSPERSSSEGHLRNLVHESNCDIVDRNVFCHSTEAVGEESNSNSSLNEISGFLLRTRSANSVPYLLEPCSMSVLSRGASDASLRSNFLWRQDAVDDDEDFNFPESSV